LRPTKLDEALGIGSSLTGLANNSALPSPFEAEAEDYFRYSSTNTRAITTNPNPSPNPPGVYFSYNGGSANVAQFNQDNNNGDRNDWIFTWLPRGRRIMFDAIGCQNQAVPVGTAPEVIVLNSLG